nr:hypothetical protein CK203_042279 [Ipomoea batatas]
MYSKHGAAIFCATVHHFRVEPERFKGVDPAVAGFNPEDLANAGTSPTAPHQLPDHGVHPGAEPAAGDDGGREPAPAQSRFAPVARLGGRPRSAWRKGRRRRGPRCFAGGQRSPAERWSPIAVFFPVKRLTERVRHGWKDRLMSSTDKTLNVNIACRARGTLLAFIN